MAAAQFFTKDHFDDPLRIDCGSIRVIHTDCRHPQKEQSGKLQSHAYCEILYVFSGSGSIVVGDTLHPLKAGDLVIINPDLPHSESSADGHELQLGVLGVLGFTVDGLPKDHLIPAQMAPVLPGKDYRYKIERYLSDILAESQEQTLLSGAMSRTLASALLILILRLCHSRSCKGADMKEECRRIKEYIDKNYTSPITLDSLSEQIYISKYYLSHIFKSQTGISPIKYLIGKRMDKAAQLLRETDLSIRDIALRVGYDDPVYFSQMFKKVMNESPANYRSSQK